MSMERCKKLRTNDFDSIRTLSGGFRLEAEPENGDKKPNSVCIYCDKAVSPDDMASHLSQHTDAERFQTILHADSIFGFTAKEKSYLSLVFAGYKDEEIAAKMGIPAVSARRMRNQFNNQMRMARGLLAMGDLLGDKLKRRKKEKSKKQGTEIPSLDKAGTVTALYNTKRELHGDGALHMTTIIAVVKRDPETTEPALLIVDKGDQKTTLGETEISALDLLGGHLRTCDLGGIDPGDIIGNPLPIDAAMWSCARRELERELVSPAQAPENLHFWFEDRYTGENAEGVNNELSWVFFCRYSGTLDKLNTPGEPRVKDDWIDSIGAETSRTYVGRFWRLSEIMEEAARKPKSINDGLMRVLTRLKSDKALTKALDNALD